MPELVPVSRSGRTLKRLETFEDFWEESERLTEEGKKRAREEELKQERKYGRPPKLTYQVLETIAMFVRNGGTAVTAAQAVGVDAATFENWMRRGSEELQEWLKTDGRGRAGIYVHFFRAIVAAKAQFRIEKEIEVGEVAAYWLKYQARDTWHDQPLQEKGTGEAKAAIVELVRGIRTGKIGGSNE